MRFDVVPRAGAQCSGATRAAMHKGAKNSACKKTPPVKCATLKTSDNASIPASLSDDGVAVMSEGAGVIDRAASGDLKTTYRPIGFACIGTHSEMGDRDERDRRYPRQQRTLCKVHPDVEAGSLGHRQGRDPRA